MIAAYIYFGGILALLCAMVIGDQVDPDPSNDAAGLAAGFITIALWPILLVAILLSFTLDPRKGNV